MRIQRALARSGIASRRRADELVAAGRVHVNGQVARIGQSVDPLHDRITVDGADVAPPAAQATWIVVNKPAGVLTSRTNANVDDRRTVFDLVPPTPGLTYVGRLDYMTEGLLLLTTDGEAAHRLTHPSRGVERTYVATVRGDAVSAARAARGGVRIDDGVVVRPIEAVARAIGLRRWEFEVTIAEGRHHEVRRLCEALGLSVERLVRTRFGPVELGSLGSGESRGLTATERRSIEAMTHEAAPHGGNSHGGD
jgi:23S rRNA pseudouridine2605 synthase